jgi:hypothetical protein
MEAHAHAVAALELEAMVTLGLDAGVGIACNQHSGGEVPPGVAGEVSRDRQLRQIHGGPGHGSMTERRVGDHHRLHVVLDAARVLGGEPALVDPEREGQRAAARDHVADDGHVVAGDALEHQDGGAAPPLVLEDERHDVFLDRDRLGDPDHLAGVRPLVGRDEAPEVLVGHGSRSYPETGSEVEMRPKAEVLHLVLVELAVGRVAVEVLEQDL